MGDLKISVRPTLGSDGSLFLVPAGTGYIYGLNPNLEELWRYPPGPDAREANEITPFLLSPVREEYGYAARRAGSQNEIIRINTAHGAAERRPLDSKFTGFHRPLVLRGEKEGRMFLAAYSVEDGVLACGFGCGRSWQKVGPVSAPASDRRGNRIFAVQGGRFRAYDSRSGNELCSAGAASPLEATSNLVADGEDNVYFWNNRILYGYTADCRRFLNQDLKGRLPEKLELLYGPEGSLYARSEEDQSLYLLGPAAPDLNLDLRLLADSTIYHGAKIRVPGDVEIPGGTGIVLRAREEVSFGTGFTVRKGASLSCGTGY